MAFPDKLVIADENLHTFIQAYQVRLLLPPTNAAMPVPPTSPSSCSATGRAPSAMLKPNCKPISSQSLSIKELECRPPVQHRSMQGDLASTRCRTYSHTAAPSQVLVKVGDLNRRRVVHAVEQQLSPPSNDGPLAAAQTNGHTSAMIAAQPVTALVAAASHASSSPDAGQRRCPPTEYPSRPCLSADGS